MGRRRRSSVMDALDAFNSTYKTVGGVLRDNELRNIADAKESESKQVNDRAATADEMARAQAETSGIAAQDAATFAPQEGEAPLPAASDYGMGNKVVTGNKTEFLGKTYDQAPTDIQKRSARSMAQAGILEKFGDPAAGANLRAASMNLDKAELERANSEEMRAALNPAAAGVAGALGTNQSQPGAAPDDNGLDGYLQRVAPKAVQTMLKQGNLEGAKRFQDFTDSEQGRNYSKAWLGGVRKLAIGDNHGALKDFEGMYNQQLYADGKTVKLKASGDGSQYVIEQFDLDGKLLGSKTMPTADIAKHAALALEPTKAVTFMAEQQGKREVEATALEKAQVVEGYKDQRESMKEDRRDERESMKEDRRDARESRSAKNKGSNVTLTQKSNNLEIVAARRKLAGMNAEDVRRKTQQYTATGRTNDDYDPQLARAVSLANQRKVGDDPEFDSHNAPKPQPAASNAGALNRANVAKNFRSDRAMDGYRLGRDVPDSKDVPGGGVEVLDKTGKVVGHYR